MQNKITTDELLYSGKYIKTPQIRLFNPDIIRLTRVTFETILSSNPNAYELKQELENVWKKIQAFKIKTRDLLRKAKIGRSFIENFEDHIIEMQEITGMLSRTERLTRYDEIFKEFSRITGELYKDFGFGAYSFGLVYLEHFDSYVEMKNIGLAYVCSEMKEWGGNRRLGIRKSINGGEISSEEKEAYEISLNEVVRSRNLFYKLKSVLTQMIGIMDKMKKEDIVREEIILNARIPDDRLHDYQI